MDGPIANGSPRQTVQIFLPGELLGTAADSRIKCETGEPLTSKTDRKRRRRPTSSVGKGKRERQLLTESGFSSSHDRQRSPKKSKQNDDNVYTLHPLQDYLHPGLDGTPSFELIFTHSQIELG